MAHSSHHQMLLLRRLRHAPSFCADQLRCHAPRWAKMADTHQQKQQPQQPQPRQHAVAPGTRAVTLMPACEDAALVAACSSGAAGAREWVSRGAARCGDDARCCESRDARGRGGACTSGAIADCSGSRGGSSGSSSSGSVGFSCGSGRNERAAASGGALPGTGGSGGPFGSSLAWGGAWGGGWGGACGSPMLSTGPAPPAWEIPSASTRMYNTWRYPKRKFTLPDDVKRLVEAKEAEANVARIPDFEPPPVTSWRPLGPSSRRVGCLAVKAGMTQAWDEAGVRVPLTVLFVDDCQVVGVKSVEKHGYWALQVGAGYRKQKALSPSEAGFFLSKGVPFKRSIVECRVSEDALLPVGTRITAGHFVAGQRVDVSGRTKYKGFAGVMKRWGFSGQPASHGVSLSHRAPGSIGNRTDPGRVWKGKKMPGHMGDEAVTMHGCRLYKVDPGRNLLYVRGQVPGPAGAFVLLRDALGVPRDERASWGVPLPTYPGDPAELPVSVYRSPKDKYRPYTEDGADYFPIEWKKGD